MIETKEQAETLIRECLEEIGMDVGKYYVEVYEKIRRSPFDNNTAQYIHVRIFKSKRLLMTFSIKENGAAWAGIHCEQGKNYCLQNWSSKEKNYSSDTRKISQEEFITVALLQARKDNVL